MTTRESEGNKRFTKKIEAEIKKIEKEIDSMFKPTKKELKDEKEFRKLVKTNYSSSRRAKKKV